jgi:HNH endonuclease/AP2 domain
VEGRWPKGEIDHVNGNKDDNRWENLREATRSQNIANARTPGCNTSGYKGVYFDRSKPRVKPWRASITVDGRTVRLGYFATPEKAWLAYVLAARKHYGDFARIEAGGVTFFQNRGDDDDD